MFADRRQKARDRGVLGGQHGLGLAHARAVLGRAPQLPPIERLGRGLARHVLDIVRLVNDDDGAGEVNVHCAANGRIEQVRIRAEHELSRLGGQCARREIWTPARLAPQSNHVLHVPRGQLARRCAQRRQRAQPQRAAREFAPAALALQQALAVVVLVRRPRHVLVHAVVFAAAEHGHRRAVGGAPQLAHDLRQLRVRARRIVNLGRAQTLGGLFELALVMRVLIEQRLTGGKGRLDQVVVERVAGVGRRLATRELGLL